MQSCPPSLPGIDACPRSDKHDPSMNKPSAPNELQKLLTHFDVIGLGEGDPLAGCNLLAAMATTLANLARPGSGIQTPYGRVIPVGCNLLASGPRVAQLMIDEIVTPVGRYQDNLIGQLERLLENHKEEEAKGPARSWSINNGAKSEPGQSALFRIMTSSSELGPLMSSWEKEWMTVLAHAPSQRLSDLLQRPRSFVAASRPDQLEQLLSRIHLGEGLVALGLTNPAEAARFGALCPALMDGLLPGGPRGELIRARFLITDPGRVLHQIATAANDMTAWLGRLVWLVDGDAGPEIPAMSAYDGKTVRLTGLTTRFETEVRRMLAMRLNTENPGPLRLDGGTFDFMAAQIRWMGFLGDMEKSLPGISGMARSLFASLVFGMWKLARAAPKGFVYHLEEIEALARLMTHRMSNARAALLYSEDDARRQRLKMKILDKLAHVRLDFRSICRFHIPADICRELLLELKSEGRVRAVGNNEWELVEEIAISCGRHNIPTFEA